MDGSQLVQKVTLKHLFVETNLKPADWPAFHAKFMQYSAIFLTSLFTSKNIGKLYQQKDKSVLNLSARVPAPIGEVNKTFEPAKLKLCNHLTTHRLHLTLWILNLLITTAKIVKPWSLSYPIKTISSLN